MKFGVFLFPESVSPEDDYRAINEALEEACLADRLGYHSVWIGEHHFDGTCSYSDPMVFAGSVIAKTTDVKIGFSAIQTALHHPVRLAEQIALLDNLSDGRIIVGTSRGTAFNFYEYRGFGVDPADGQQLLDEAEIVMVKTWTQSQYNHEGKKWTLDIPTLRPRPIQIPHPLLIRAVATKDSIAEMGKQGRPIMMVRQSNEATFNNIETYKDAMKNAGFRETDIIDNMSNLWVWRDVYVGNSNSEAEAVAIPAHEANRRRIVASRVSKNTLNEESSIQGSVNHPRFNVDQSLIVGSPSTVADKLRPLYEMGIGGIIAHFRVGEISFEDNEKSMRLFAEEVMPQFISSS